MKNNRIFFLIDHIPPQYGGGFFRLYKIANRLKKKGCFYKIATYTSLKEFEEDLEIKREEIIHISSIWMSSLELVFYLISNYRKYDILYVTTIRWYHVVPAIFAKVIRKKLVIGITMSMQDSPAEIAKSRLHKLYLKFKYLPFRFADKIYVNSLKVQKECYDTGIPEKRIALINNPVDTSLFAPADDEKKTILRKKLGINNNHKIVVFIGSINKRKGCDVFPALFEHFFRIKKVPINFVMCGETDRYDETKAILDSLDIIFKANDSNLVVKDNVKNVNEYFQVADWFIFPTTKEGMPNVILEAMACGCPILCNKLDGITDYILPKEFLIRENSIEEYVEKMVRMQPKQIEELTISNRLRILRDFSIESEDAKFIDYLSR